MAKICFDCGKNLTFIDPKIDLKRLRKVAALNGYTDKMITRMNDDDVICVGCSDKLDKKVEEQKLEETVSRNKNTLPSQKLSSSGVMADKEIPTKGNPMSPTPKSKPYVQPSTETTTVTSLTTITDLRHDEFKQIWQKGRVVQFKNDKIAILMRAHASQVQFIVAFDQVTREGFRLMAIDEGKEGSAGGFSGGVTSYYYFQKIDYVR